MMTNERFIKITAIVTLVLFIIMAVISVFVILAGIGVTGGMGDTLTDVVGYADADSPGSGWFLVGGIFGSLFGGFVGIAVIVFGIMIALVNGIIYLPAFIGFMIWRKKRNAKAYWICMLIWLGEILACFTLLMVI